MSDPLYNIVFYGIISPGKDRDLVKENLAKMFKTDVSKINSLFSGDKKYIKKQVNQATAEKYKQALENAGAVVTLEETESPAAGTGNKQAGAQSDSQIDTGDLSIAEVGAVVLEHPPQVTPQVIDDISALSMSEVGDDLQDEHDDVEAQAIDDISSITLAEVGDDLQDEHEDVEAQAIDDISSLTLAEAGADVYEHPPKKKKAEIPDISDIKLAQENGE